MIMKTREKDEFIENELMKSLCFFGKNDEFHAFAFYEFMNSSFGLFPGGHGKGHFHGHCFHGHFCHCPKGMQSPQPLAAFLADADLCHQGHAEPTATCCLSC